MKKLYLILFTVALSQAALAEKTEKSAGFSTVRSKESKGSGEGVPEPANVIPSASLVALVE